MENHGTAYYPVVSSLPVSGALGQHVSLSSDGFDYRWDPSIPAWVRIFTLVGVPDVTGSRADGGAFDIVALRSLLTALANLGLITDSTTA